MSEFNTLIEQDTNNLADTDLHVPEQITTKITIVERQLNHDEIHINPVYEKINPVGIDSGYFQAMKTFVGAHGQRSPIIINRRNVILDGHKTFRALKELSLNPIRCEIKTFEDTFDEQAFIINSNLSLVLPDNHKYMLIWKLGNVLKSKVLARQDLTYLTHGTCMGSYLVSLEFHYDIINILRWRLCCFCVVDKKEDPFVGPYPKAVDEDKWSTHILHHLENDGGWSKYAPKLLSFSREIDPKTHDWRFIPIDDTKERIQEFLLMNNRINSTASQAG